MRTPRPEEQRRKLTFAFRKEEWMTFSGGAELVAIWRTSPGSAAAADMERARTGHGRYITASHDTTNWKHACADVVTRANREPAAHLLARWLERHSFNNYRGILYGASRGTESVYGLNS